LRNGNAISGATGTVPLRYQRRQSQDEV